MAIVSGQHIGVARGEWNAQVNRARDAFQNAYLATHGHPIGCAAAWYGSAQYRDLMQQEPGRS